MELKKNINIQKKVLTQITTFQKVVPRVNKRKIIYKIPRRSK